MKITDITLDRLQLELDPPFNAAWDPEPRHHFDATNVRVHADEGLTGLGSGDTMYGFEAFRHPFTGKDPLDIVRHVRAIETANFHGGVYWPLEAALWDIIGKVNGRPEAERSSPGSPRRRPPMSTSQSALPARRWRTAGGRYWTPRHTNA